MDILALLKGINKDNFIYIAFALLTFLFGAIILSIVTRKPLNIKLGPISFSFGEVKCECKEEDLQIQALSQSEKIKPTTNQLYIERIHTYIQSKEKQVSKLYADVMVRQMNFCDEKLVEIKDIFIEEYSKLLSKKISQTEDVRVHHQFRNYKMFLSLMLEYCVKETTFKKSVRQNHLAELTMEGWEAFVEQKVNVTIANIKNSYDNDYPDESIVTRKEVDESNERVFDKIRPMIVSMYRKAREISIETKSKIKFIEEEMETHLKGGVEESLPIILEE